MYSKQKKYTDSDKDNDYIMTADDCKWPCHLHSVSFL